MEVLCLPSQLKVHVHQLSQTAPVFVLQSRPEGSIVPDGAKVIINAATKSQDGSSLCQQSCLLYYRAAVLHFSLDTGALAFYNYSNAQSHFDGKHRQNKINESSFCWFTKPTYC